jgi:hypothetical protein
MRLPSYDRRECHENQESRRQFAHGFNIEMMGLSKKWRKSLQSRETKYRNEKPLKS